MNTDVQEAILKYLQENKSANTFKLARNLGVDREKLVRELAKLQEKGLIEHRTGMARFLSMPKPEALRPEEPGPTKKISKLKTERPRIKKRILPANTRLAEENKKLRTKLSEFESRIGQQAGVERRLKAQNTHVGRLEEEIKTLQQKASIAPKVIRKTIVKTIVRRVPAKSTETEKMPASLSVEAGKPARSSVSGWLSNLTKIGRNISQLSMPEVFKQKVVLKRTSLGLNKLKDNISKLEIPDMLKKGW